MKKKEAKEGGGSTLSPRVPRGGNDGESHGHTRGLVKSLGQPAVVCLTCTLRWLCRVRLLQGVTMGMR